MFLPMAALFSRKAMVSILCAGLLASCGSDDDDGPGSGASGGATGTGGRAGAGGAAGSSTGGSGGADGSGGAPGTGGGSGGGAGSGGATGGSGGRIDAGGDGASDLAAAGDGGGQGDATVAGEAGAAPAGCTLQWSPSAMRDGDKAFEFLEMPDRNMIHAGTPHLTAVPERDAYRFDSHYDPPGTVDFDCAVFTGPVRNDRMRGEVRGMMGASGQLDMLEGQTWKTSWSLFIPASLQGTGRFTHIYQLKYIDKGGGVSGSPIITLSLARPDNMALRLWLGGGSFPTISLANLHDRWLWTEVTVKVGPAATGTVRWVLKDGDKVLVDTQVRGTTWPADAARVRHKWGIYRGITDGVKTTYMMAADFKGYLCQ